MLPDQLHDGQPDQLPPQGVEGDRGRRGLEALRLPDGRVMRRLSLRPVSPELRARLEERRPRRLPHVPDGAGSDGSEGRDGRRLEPQPADDPWLPVGDLLHGPRAGSGIPGAAVRGGTRPNQCRRPREHRVLVRGVPREAAGRAVAIARLAPHDSALREGDPGGAKEILNDRGGSSAPEAGRQDHRRVLSPDGRGRSQLQHPPMARGRRRRGVPGGHHRLDGLSPAARPAALRGLFRHRARRAAQAGSGPAGPGHLSIDLQPAARRARATSLTSCRASSNCGGSRRRTSTVDWTAARATCSSARRSGPICTRRPT